VFFFASIPMAPLRQFAARSLALSAPGAQRAAYASSAGPLRQTPLYDLNVSKGGKMVEFGGWAMPVTYGGPDGGIVPSHLHTRRSAGLFDVSHMVPVKIHGKDRAAFMERVVVGDIRDLPANMGTLSLITNDKGGLVDDCIVTNAGDYIYLVINAGHEEKDLPHMEAILADFKAKGGDASIEVIAGSGLLALQGPKAVEVLGRLCPGVDFKTVKFMSGHKMKVAGYECFVTRSGYTGEDGFELGVRREDTLPLATLLLDEPEVLPVGLGARDSLRLEAGLCLYGNDLDDTTTPAEAGLVWTIGGRRKKEGGFTGADIVLKQIADKKVARKRVGFTTEGATARPGSAIFTKDGVAVGTVTSGATSPCLKKPIGMAYVASAHSKVGTELTVEVRNKKQPLTIAKMPFTEPGYFRG